MSAGVTRIVVVDDHELVRTGLRGVLSADDGFAVVGEAADGHQALAAVEVHRPDLVVMDLQMPGMGGIEATRRIAAGYPATAVLVVTMFDDDDSVFAAVRAGARGYVLKGAGRDELRAAVRSVASGQAVFGPGVAARVLDRMARPATASSAFPQLTPRERAVLEGLVADLGPAAIGRRLGVAEKTVRNNVSSILTKLQVTDRAAAVVAARAAGMAPAPAARRLTMVVAHRTGAGAGAGGGLGLPEVAGRHGGTAFGPLPAHRAWFADPGAALATAVEAHRALGPVLGGDEGADHTGIAVHAGVVVEAGDDGDLVGVAVVEAAQVAVRAAALGAVLVTGEALPAGVETDDLGDHDLDGVDRPLRLHRLNV